MTSRESAGVTARGCTDIGDLLWLRAGADRPGPFLSGSYRRARTGARLEPFRSANRTTCRDTGRCGWGAADHRRTPLRASMAAAHPRDGLDRARRPPHAGRAGVRARRTARVVAGAGQPRRHVAV